MPCDYDFSFYKFLYYILLSFCIRSRTPHLCVCVGGGGGSTPPPLKFSLRKNMNFWTWPKTIIFYFFHVTALFFPGKWPIFEWVSEWKCRPSPVSRKKKRRNHPLQNWSILFSSDNDHNVQLKKWVRCFISLPVTTNSQLFKPKKFLRQNLWEYASLWRNKFTKQSFFSFTVFSSLFFFSLIGRKK